MKRIITIGREFGSGGHEIGKLAAEALGIAFYDKELLAAVAKESGFSERYIEEGWEYATATNSLLFNIAVSSGYNTPGKGLTPSDQVYVLQSNLIRDLAEEEPCVIVGRCADYILRERTDCLHVFLYADMDYRKKRIVERYGQTKMTPENRLKDKDKRRQVFYRHYTGRDWGSPHNYGLCLNTSTLGTERCVEILTDLYRTL